MFNKYDSNGDGTIDKDEFHDMCYALGHYLDGETFEVAWTEVEADGSGSISYDEFATWWSSDDRWAHLQLSDEEIANLAQVHSYFKYYDIENSGQLNKDEFRGVYNYMKESGYDVNSFDAVLNEIDTSGDGLINYNEFIVWMVEVGVLVNSDIKIIAIKNHRKSMIDALSLGSGVSFKTLVLFASECGAPLLFADTDDESCCSVLSAFLTWIGEGDDVKGQVIFEQEHGTLQDSLNPHVLALAVFSAVNANEEDGNHLFATLTQFVCLEEQGYGGSAKLLARVVEHVDGERSGAGGEIFNQVVAAAMEGIF